MLSHEKINPPVLKNQLIRRKNQMNNNLNRNLKRKNRCFQKSYLKISVIVWTVILISWQPLYCTVSSAKISFSDNKSPSKSAKKDKERLLQLSLLECYNKYFDSIYQTPVYSHVKMAFIDTLASWKTKKLRYMNLYNREIWKIDKRICFNTIFSKCYLFILQIDTVKGAVLDRLEFVYGSFENNKWNFYFSSLPSYALEKRYLKKRYSKSKIINPKDFQLLEKYLENDIIIKYLFANNTCSINDKFFEMFTNEFTKQQHENYLNDPQK